MDNLFSILALGFFLGMRHATDADHVIAVSTIVSKERSARSAAAIGAAWGLGHTLTILLVGGGIVLFGWVIPPRLGLSMELSVGVMLIALGAANLGTVLRSVRQAKSVAQTHDAAVVHSHAHAHGDYVHTHPHGHDPERHLHEPDQTPVHWLDRRLGALRLYQLLRPLFVGVVHGLAGSAAVALLVIPAIGNSLASIWYLILFGLGTIAGMMLITAALSAPFVFTTVRLERVNFALRAVTGAASLVFGVVIAWEMMVALRATG